MPYLTYQQTNGAKADHLKELEMYLDNNRESIPLNVHDELVIIYDEANDAAEGILEELEELRNRVTELEKILDGMEEEE